MTKVLKTRVEAYSSLSLLAMAIAIVVLMSGWENSETQNIENKELSETTTVIEPIAAIFPILNDPLSLSDNDKQLYKNAFSLQNKKQWSDADNIIEQINNPILIGHVLAQRYLHKNYKSTKSELSEWLKQYSDLPQARKIYNIARARGIKTDKPKTAKSRLKGFGESFKNARHKSPKISNSWKTGLAYWKGKKFSKAYRIFSALEKRAKSMGAVDRAAISFWAYRAANEIGENEKARTHLKLAAKFPRSFYGAQAVHLLGDTLDETVFLRGENNISDYIANIETETTKNSLIRINALISIEKNKMAQNELLHQYSLTKAKDRAGFIHLAQKLNMPATQLRMGVDMERKGVVSGKALYPLPAWQPENGYIVDPAIIFAIARQESGFNTKARSYSGARGMMQIMPETAKYIAKKMHAGKNIRLDDPDMNVNLGQNYLRYLANKPYIKGNIVLMAAAYNAGPGNAKRWSRKSSIMKDPLYFIETIPFSETRNYVMNVMTNYWMYREIMNDGNQDVTLLSEGKWPKTKPISNGEVKTADLSWSNAS